MNAKLWEQRGWKVRLRHHDLTANHFRIVEMGAIYMISMVIGNPQKSEQTDLHSNNVEHVHQDVTLLVGIKSNLQVFQVLLQSFKTTLEAVPSVDRGGRRPGYWGPSIEFR